jgi:hypothetical protein
LHTQANHDPKQAVRRPNKQHLDDHRLHQENQYPAHHLFRQLRGGKPDVLKTRVNAGGL